MFAGWFRPDGRRFCHEVEGMSIWDPVYPDTWHARARVCTDMPERFARGANISGARVHLGPGAPGVLLGEGAHAAAERNLGSHGEAGDCSGASRVQAAGTEVSSS
jgi:hypothetical protein